MKALGFTISMILLMVVTIVTIITIKDREQRRIDSMYSAKPDPVSVEEQADNHRRNGEL